jgi:hypothetical protein
MRDRGGERPEDAELIAFCEGRSEHPNLNAMAEELQRPRHSLAARIKILQRRGKISADWKPGPRVRRKIER